MKRRSGTPSKVMQLRRHWVTVLAVAGSITCRRCGQPIRPGDDWDLGHPPDQPYAFGNRIAGLQPEHRTCNRTGYVAGPAPAATFPGWGPE